jgi:hypothetical protein
VFNLNFNQYDVPSTEAIYDLYRLHNEEVWSFYLYFAHPCGMCNEIGSFNIYYDSEGVIVKFIDHDEGKAFVNVLINHAFRRNDEQLSILMLGAAVIGFPEVIPPPEVLGINHICR